ncbi:MAG: pallilysin-related adhesin, partial [Spirochaetaceae bacterium]|nr:pallilysin-related adhesin [Spirochaetaceae bacterium]
MKRFTAILFIILAAGLIWAGFNRDRFIRTADTRQYNTKLVIPVSPGGAEQEETGENRPAREEPQFISFMPLEAGETLIQAITTDFNGDGMEDQINIVKKGNRQSLYLAVVLYNSRTNGFYRATQVDTGISEAGTFSVSVSDVTGEGINSIVYTGIAATGETVLTILSPSWGQSDNLSLKTIANLRADGTIFIEETYRSDAYSIGLTRGESFPIWVYTTDPDSPPQTLDQVLVGKADRIRPGEVKAV